MKLMGKKKGSSKDGKNRKKKNEIFIWHQSKRNDSFNDKEGELYAIMKNGPNISLLIHLSTTQHNK